MKKCHCQELIINEPGHEPRTVEGPILSCGRHDCAEVARRNSFIPLAESHAIKKAGSTNHTAFGVRFTREFSMEMDRLCALQP